MADAQRAEDALAAGRAALACGAWGEARSWFEDALSSGTSPEALEGLSWAAWWLEDVGSCLAAREGAYRLYRRAGDMRGAARMALWLSDDHMEFRGAGAVAGGWLRRASRILDELEPSPEHGWLAVFEGFAALGGHDPATAERLAGEAREAGLRHGAVDLEMFALACEGMALIALGDVAGGLVRLDEAAAAAVGGEYENLVPAAWSCCLVMSACEQVRDVDRGAQWCQRIEEFSRGVDARFLTGVCRAHYGVIHAWRGDWEVAERELVGALDDLTVRRPAWRSEALVRLGQFRWQQGRLVEATELFDQAPEHPLALLGMAAVCLDRNEPVQARDLLERVLRQVPPERMVGRAEPLELLVHAHVELGQHEVAAERLDELHSVASAVSTGLLRGAAFCCDGLLAAAVGDHERACDRFEDAVDLFTRGRAPVDVARARLGLAGSLLALDRRDAAEREARLALAGLDGIDAERERARGGALLDRLASHVGSEGGQDLLTARQVEVLRLVADGLSDQEIAAKLVLSAHTVHRHVANIHTRLGCSSRAAAVAQAGRLGLV